MAKFLKFVLTIFLVSSMLSPTGVCGMRLFAPLDAALNGFFEVVSVFKVLLSRDESIFDTKLPCPTDENGYTEQQMYDMGVNYLANKQWADAYTVLARLSNVINEVEQQRYPHCISIDDPIDVLILLEKASFNLNMYDDATKLCYTVLQHENLTPDRRAKMEEALKEIDRSFVDETMKEVIADFASNDSTRMELGIKKLDKIPHYQLCSDEQANKGDFEMAKNRLLYCRYSWRNQHPLLILSPVKEEILSLDPLVVFFHDIISSADAETMKGLSRERLSSSQVFGAEETQEYTRKSKVAWLAASIMPKMTDRIEATVGMDPRDLSSEAYQIAYYQKAGHYLPHYDYFGGQLVENEFWLGDRIATLLMYLSDVKMGGRTVFLKLGLSVTPKARGALFWYNAFRNESGDDRTLHAACPVLQGEKWAVNKWFRYRGQMLYKPCLLDSESTHFSPDDFSLQRYLIEDIRTTSLRKPDNASRTFLPLQMSPEIIQKLSQPSIETPDGD